MGTVLMVCGYSADGLWVQCFGFMGTVLRVYGYSAEGLWVKC